MRIGFLSTRRRLLYANDVCPLPHSDLPSLRHSTLYAYSHYRASDVTKLPDGYSVQLIRNRLISWTRIASTRPPEILPRTSLINIYEWLPKFEPRANSSWHKFGPSYTCAYVKLTPNFTKTWSKTTLHSLKKFQRSGILIRSGTSAEVRAVYQRSKILKSIKKTFIAALEKQLSFDTSSISILVATLNDVPVACLVASQASELKLSEYMIGAYDPAYSQHHAMIGLFKAWHDERLAAGDAWLSLGHIEPRAGLGPWTGNGYSIFKLQFGIQRVWLPGSQWKICFSFKPEKLAVWQSTGHTSSALEQKSLELTRPIGVHSKPMNFNELASPDVVENLLPALKERNITGHLVTDKAAALAKIQELIPAGASVMTGSSMSLTQIGFIDLLKSGNHPWNNLKEAIVAETDADKQNELRRQSVLAQVFLGSVHALTADGIALIASASGSQLPAYAFTSDTVIWVVGTQKIVPTLDDAFKRVREHVFPLEDARMKETGAPGSVMAKWLIFEREVMPRNVHMILINEVVGF